MWYHMLCSTRLEPLLFLIYINDIPLSENKILSYSFGLRRQNISRPTNPNLNSKLLKSCLKYSQIK